MENKWRKIIAIISVPVLGASAFLAFWFIRPEKEKDNMPIPQIPGPIKKTYNIEFDMIQDIQYLSSYSWSNATFRESIIDEMINIFEEEIIINNPDNQVFDIRLEYLIKENYAMFSFVDEYFDGEKKTVETIDSFKLEINTN